MTANPEKQSLIAAIGQAFSIYSKKKVFMLLFFGFSAGLPFLLVFSTLTWWLNSVGIEKATIGLFAWVGMLYSIKVLWAPILDSLDCPFWGKQLGRRRGWMLAGQLGIALGLVAMSFIDPSSHITLFAIAALVVAFSSATQDVAIDAYRIDSAEDRYQGAMSACYVGGYRCALLVAGGFALYLSESMSFPQIYRLMALLMFVGLISTLIVTEPERDEKSKNAAAEALKNKSFPARQRIRDFLTLAVWLPFRNFYDQYKSLALTILLFISIYRLSDLVMGIMANPFYQDLGFSASEVALVIKFYGFFLTILGSFFGGIWVYRRGIYPTLLTGATLVAATNLAFAALALAGKSTTFLVIVISLDNFSGGLAAVAFVAYLSSLVNKAYSATQYALFASLMTLPGKFISGFSGYVVAGSGYFYFFIYSAALGLPAILFVLYLMRQNRQI